MTVQEILRALYMAALYALRDVCALALVVVGIYGIYRLMWEMHRDKMQEGGGNGDLP